MKLLLIIISASVFQNCDKVEQTEKTPIVLSIGIDTTILYGDTLIIDAGADFDSYKWNDNLSTEQKLSVTEAGLYWVEVTKGCQKGTDSIKVDTINNTVNSCDTIVTFFEKCFFNTPCSYTYRNNIGEDSQFIDIRSENQDVVLSYERYITFQYDTIQQLPESYKNSFNNKVIISYKNNEELGVIFFKTTTGTLRNTAGYFLIKENSYYLELMQLSYSDTKTNELTEILSTLKFQHN